ncbi:hypothetical protein PHAVU_007G077200 [Phaseolus vulgaris]|uniref:CAAX prenyl protease 2/Lysostaphin resistance protein A-like domain-containing protein n=1 Tax=Phaseolus vulgaris TaxID=3885 RepID=V7BD52_PHAVU|nr:hypothetical protein PHAVU_007G077200g [Phaseolus vulgaris]ESW15500.1 hypothetical protein PHAVU_007G077200g [Phaseolus vulgaris]
MFTTISSLPFSLSLHHNSRVSPFYLPSAPIPFQSSITFPTKKWRFLCYRHENSSSEINGSELKDDKLAEDLVKLEGDQSDDLKKDWFAAIHEVITVIHNVEPWTVPWTAKTIVQVMLLWIASFWFVGSWIVPFLAYTAGFRKDSLTYRGQALYSLLTDVAEGVVGIAILWHCLAKFQPLSSDWFKFELKGKWQFDVGLGCLMFPFINQLSQMNLNLLPVLQYTPVTISSVEQSIVARDPVAMALYAVVVSVCAPIWEEIVFRGFLLPSLTKYMPVWSAILVSSVSFALAHFNIQRILPLVFLGMVMGTVFVRSRNLLPSMLLHSLWNAFVFLDLMK